MLSWSFKVMNMSTATRPTVLSISWGGGESGYPVPVMQAANVEFQKMGLLGISLFAVREPSATIMLSVLSVVYLLFILAW